MVRARLGHPKILVPLNWIKTTNRKTYSNSLGYLRISVEFKLLVFASEGGEQPLWVDFRPSPMKKAALYVLDIWPNHHGEPEKMAKIEMVVGAFRPVCGAAGG